MNSMNRRYINNLLRNTTKYHRIMKYMVNFKNLIHSNLYMIIGCYGIVTIIFICFSTQWLFQAQLLPLFEPLLPPAWQNSGDLNHLLGTDKQGIDIFDYLLIAYQSTLILTLHATCYVIVIGALMNYMLLFISPLRTIITAVFNVITAIPPILTAMVVTLLRGDNINAILIILCLSYFPRFVHNIHTQIMQEWQKTYITIYRLDGLSTSKILSHHIIPNILSAYLTEIATLFSHIMLALTILTFLGFGNSNIDTPDLGMMMKQMLNIIIINHWAFLSSGIAIIMTILFIHLLNLGISTLLTNKVEN